MFSVLLHRVPLQSLEHLVRVSYNYLLCMYPCTYAGPYSCACAWYLNRGLSITQGGEVPSCIQISKYNDKDI